MISVAVQSACKSVIANSYLMMGDEEIQSPYCTHREIETPIRLKEGLAGYEYSCEVLIIDDDPEDLDGLKRQMITAMEALTGTTVDGTVIDMVDYTGDEPDFDTESNLYTNILKFTIETSN